MAVNGGKRKNKKKKKAKVSERLSQQVFRRRHSTSTQARFRKHASLTYIDYRYSSRSYVPCTECSSTMAVRHAASYYYSSNAMYRCLVTCRECVRSMLVILKTIPQSVEMKWLHLCVMLGLWCHISVFVMLLYVGIE